jgi:hypothetical protein
VNNYKNNIAFIEKISPTRLIISGFVLWVVLFFTSPLTVQISLNLEAFLFIFFSVFSFLLGTLLVKKRRFPLKTLKSKRTLYNLFRIILIASIIGIVFKYYDRFLIRGITFSLDFFNNREIMEEASGNIIGIIGSILSPFSLFPLFLYWKYQLKMPVVIRFIIYSIFVLQVSDSILLGSRSSLFVTFIFLMFYLIYFKKIKIEFKNIFVTIFFVIAFILFLNYIFIERTKIFAGDNTYSVVLSESNFNYTLTASQDFKDSFENQTPLFQNLLFTYISTIQYYSHGMFEFCYLYENFKRDHFFGLYTFSLYYRFLNKITGRNVNLNHLQNPAPRTGVFTTLFGPLYLDFGWFTLPFMLLLGFFSKLIFYKACAGEDPAVLMYFYLAILILLAPVFNFINGAGGLFLFTSLLLINFICRRFYIASVN